MSKRHLSRNAVAAMGDERIAKLIGLSEEAVRMGMDARARRYVVLARNIGMKTRTGIPKEFRYCKDCFLPLVPGVNCTVRLTDHKIVSSCACGSIWRMPYNKEQNEDDRERS
jgi:ribonuclease P protein subunit RPR2